MTFTNNGVRCSCIIDSKYETRIFNVSFNFPTSVTFGLRNVSVHDSGWYHAIGEYYDNFGISILLVGDTILRTCSLKQTEVEFDFPLSDFNETVAVVLCSRIRVPRYIISICNPEAGTCAPPLRATLPRYECRTNGSRITISLTSVQMEDTGLYALIGSSSRIIFQSAVIQVIECASTTAEFNVVFNTTEHPNLTTINAAVNNTGTLYSRAILSSSSPIKGKYKSFENYFVGGGVVAGMTIVILIFWFLWKRLYKIRGNGSGGDYYNNVDVHYYCSIRNQTENVTQSEATTGSVPESQQFSDVMD
ncbi:hypothetical protein ACJMK2_025248 [Sinanodonta woodiana]|uniref:Uncharacterized protein n=1 Tax=Sinanodonta woodiana TaxID=1069815 RepID=A0ABD3XIB1_SINWO